MALQMHKADLQLTHYLDGISKKIIGISYSQFIVLQAIADLGHASQAEIAETIGVTRVSIHRQVIALDKRRLIKQEHSYSHQRTHVVYLTPGAERIIPYANISLESALVALLGAAAKDLPSYQRATDVLKQLAQRLRGRKVQDTQ